jgi:hypothetical protein
VSQLTVTSLKKARKDSLRALNLQFRALSTASTAAHKYGEKIIRFKQVLQADDLNRMLRYLQSCEDAITRAQSIAEQTVMVFQALP